MKYRKLRIAWSVAWGVVAVLLCVLWVRSYSWAYIFGINSNHGFAAIDGSLIINKPLFLAALPSTGQRSPNQGYTSRLGFICCPLDVLTITRGGGGTAISIWQIVATLMSIATFGWIPSQFSLRTLLITTSLVAVVIWYIQMLSKG
jgi:hypothetical protein